MASKDRFAYMDKITPNQMFGKVASARAALRERAEEIIQRYMDVAAAAQESGDYANALKALQWLLEHMPKDEDGTNIVDRSVDKEQVVQQQVDTTPRIQIGIQVGGAQPRKALPKATVETIDADKS